MYDYSGSRDADALQAFAEGGYAEVDGEKVPSLPTIFSKFIDSMQEDVDHILKKRKNAAAVLVVVGAIIGIVIGSTLCGSGKAKSE